MNVKEGVSIKMNFGLNTPWRTFVVHNTSWLTHIVWKPGLLKSTLAQNVTYVAFLRSNI